MGPEWDDIDAGWDEVAGTVPPRAPAPSVPAPSASPSIPAPASSTEIPFEATPRATRRPEVYASSESLSPAEFTAPPSRTESTPLSRLGPVAVFAALAAATLLWLGHAPKVAAPNPAAATQPPTVPAAVVAPAPLALAPLPPVAEPAPAAAPAPVAPSPQPPSPERMQLEPLVLEAGNRAAVTVRSVPEGAVFFEGGQRLGTSEVRINVLPQSKRHLTALLNGYRPLNFKVDGTSETLTVRLTPVVAPPEPATEAPAASP